MKRKAPPRRTQKAGADKQRVTKREASVWAKAPERQWCPTPHKAPLMGRKEAKAALKAVGKAGQNGRLHIYKCRCGRFHLGTAKYKPSPAPELP